MDGDKVAKQLREASGEPWEASPVEGVDLCCEAPQCAPNETYAIWEVMEYGGTFQAARYSYDDDRHLLCRSKVIANSPGAAVDVLSQRLGISPKDEMEDDKGAPDG